MRKTRWWVAARHHIRGGSGPLPPGHRRPRPTDRRRTRRTDPIPPDPVPSSARASCSRSTPSSPRRAQRRRGPTSGIGTRHNRINYIGEVPDGSGRLYVPDLNGPLYLLERRQPPRLPRRQGASSRTSCPGAAWARASASSPSTPSSRTNGKFYTDAHRGARRARHRATTYPGQPQRRARAERGHRVDGRRPGRRHVHRHPAASCSATASPARSTPSSRSTSTRPPSPATRTTACSTSPSATAGYGVEHRHPAGADQPVRQDPADRPGRHRRPQRPVRHPGDQPVRRRGRRARRDLRASACATRTGSAGTPGGKHRMFLGHIGQHAIEAVYEVRRRRQLRLARASRAACVYDNDDAVPPLPADRRRRPPRATTTRSRPTTTTRRPTGRCNSDCGHAISGGHVYRGDLPGLKGKYVFGDLVDGRGLLHRRRRRCASEQPTARRPCTSCSSTTPPARGMRMTDFVGDGRVDLRFGTDADRNLYLLAKANGKIWKVVDTRRARGRRRSSRRCADDLVASYDFEHPFAANDSVRGGPGPLADAAPARQRRRADAGRRRRLPGQQQRPAAAQHGRVADRQRRWKAGVWNRRDGVAVAVAVHRRRGHHRDGLVQDDRHQPDRAGLQRHRPGRRARAATPTGTASAPCSS